MHLINNKGTKYNNIFVGGNEQNTEILENPIEKVRERNKFYTVSACVNKYLSYLYKKDTEILYNYLDLEYIEQNGITQSNILQKITQVDTYKIFNAKEMYKQKITDDVTKYYAYGVIKEDVEEGQGAEEEFYITIKIDSKIS